MRHVGIEQCTCIKQLLRGGLAVARSFLSCYGEILWYNMFICISVFT